jgi:hypothetical protein
MADSNAPFANLVPGFDFLQGLVRNAGSVLPGVGQWIAPTMDPEEIEKRISELKTVHFWLEQNARMITGTIQALEVQRMTLSTLKSMNVQMGDLRDALRIRPAEPAPSAEQPPERPAPQAAEPAEPAPPLVDPMQWWGALTQQFAQIATTAMEKNSGAAAAAKTLTDAMVQQSLDAGAALGKAATALPTAATEAAHKAATQAATAVAGKMPRPAPRSAAAPARKAAARKTTGVAKPTPAAARHAPKRKPG